VSVILCLYVVYLERHHPPSTLYTLHLNEITNALLHFGSLNNPPQYTHSNEYTAWQDGWTPLHYGSLKGNLEVVNILLAAGASIDVQDKVSYGFLLLDTQMNTMWMICIVVGVFWLLFLLYLTITLAVCVYSYSCLVSYVLLFLFVLVVVVVLLWFVICHVACVHKYMRSFVYCHCTRLHSGMWILCLFSKYPHHLLLWHVFKTHARTHTQTRTNVCVCCVLLYKSVAILCFHDGVVVVAVVYSFVWVCVYVCLCISVCVCLWLCLCVLTCTWCAYIYQYLGVYIFFVSVILCLYVVYLERHHPPSTLYTADVPVGCQGRLQGNLPPTENIWPNARLSTVAGVSPVLGVVVETFAVAATQKALSMLTIHTFPEPIATWNLPYSRWTSNLS